MKRRDLLVGFGAAALAGRAADTGGPMLQSEMIFPLDAKHNHASCIVELPNGDLLTCWYRGSGERTADDVVIMGARKRKGAKQWTAPFRSCRSAGVSGYEPMPLRR